MIDVSRHAWAPAFTAIFVLAAASNAAAQSPVITIAPPVVPAGSDYPTDILGNPWDFSDLLDLSPNAPTTGGLPDFYVVVGRYPGNAMILTTFFTTQLKVTIPGVPPGDYVATVVAVNAGGVSAESNAVLVSVR